MRRSHLKTRVLRALSGKTQEQFAEDIGVHPSLVAQFELGRVEPSPSHLAEMAQSVSLTDADVNELLRNWEEGRLSRERRCRGGEAPIEGLTSRFRVHVSAVYTRLLGLPHPWHRPRPEDRPRAERHWQHLKDLPEERALELIRITRELQDWALCERLCEESIRSASKDLKASTSQAVLAREVADRVVGPESWRDRIRGYAAAHEANVLKVKGNYNLADAQLEQARRLWRQGLDPSCLLDPGRLLDIEASLRKEQRRFDEALALLDQAVVVSHFPQRALTMKGFTLEVMGAYAQAVEALNEAIPLIDREAEPRLWNIAHLNLADNYVHLGRFSEAAELMNEVRPRLQDSGDEIDLIRVGWLEGRLAAGQGRSAEARWHLAQARRAFAAREMWHDVALALLEEAVVLLDEGRSAEVKELALGLQAVFEANGVHREAAAALRLFAEAAKSEAATAELGRRVLRYLFRARHDAELKMEAV